MGPIRPIGPIGPIGLIRPILLLPLLFFAACSGGEDAIEPTPQPTDQQVISFSGDLQEERTQTRAGLEEVLTNKRFVVFGYKNDGYDSGTDSYTSYQCVIPSFIVNYGAGTAHSTSSNTDDWEYVGQGDTPRTTSRADHQVLGPVGQRLPLLRLCLGQSHCLPGHYAGSSIHPR